ncbi:hypothetical protein RB195_024394 [Necator americanus]|uniref:Uncharacterized protein n=1 Tax=Necator americanus TaxID=51031 RepID=A0ABR1EN32_NECAM
MATSKRRPNLRLLRTSLILDKATHARLAMETVSDCVLTTREQFPKTLTCMPFSELQSVSNFTWLLCRRPIAEGAMYDINDGTLVIRGEKVPSRNVGGLLSAHLSSILSALPRSFYLVWPFFALPLREKPISFINCYSPTSAADES